MVGKETFFIKFYSYLTLGCRGILNPIKKKMLFERIFKKIKNKIAVLSIHVRKRKKEKRKDVREKFRRKKKQFIHSR